MAESERYTVAAIQFEPHLGDKAYNVATLLDLTETAAKHGARLIVMPELATTGYCWYNRAEIAPFVEPLPGPSCAAFGAIAARYGCYIAFGIAEVDPETDIYYNSAALIGPDGGLVGRYRKTHSFISEPRWAKDGDVGFPVWQTELGRIGIIICMDACYPEPARLIALAGADVIVFPTNWLGMAPATDWRVRAFENGVYFVAANRCGEERTVTFSGGSCIIAPDGSVQNSCKTGNGIVYGEVNLAQSRQKTFRGGSAGGIIAGRRPALYASLSLNSYLWAPWDFHRLYGVDSLPEGRDSTVLTLSPEFGRDAGIALTHLNLALAAAPRADLLVLPQDTFATPQALDGASVAGLTQLAEAHQMYIVVGLKEIAGDATYTTAVLIGPNGLIGQHRQTHSLIGNDRLGDSSPQIYDLPMGRVGLLLGDELLYPEPARILAAAGADIIAVPAPLYSESVYPLSTTTETYDSGPQGWSIVAQRAGENDCYIAFANGGAASGIYSHTFRQVQPGAGYSHSTISTINEMTNPVRVKVDLARRQTFWYAPLHAKEPPALRLWREQQ